MVTAGADENRSQQQQQQHQQQQPLWLGLDLSTQSLTAAILQGDGAGGRSNEPVVLESVNYEVNI